MAALDRVKALLASLPRAEQDNLYAYLHEMLRGDEPKKVGRHVAAVATTKGTITYRQEYVRCGRENCACRKGKLHGPYTYKYWREAGKLRKAYAGKATADVNRPRRG